MIDSTRFVPVLALAATAVAQVGWTQLNPATSPPARFGHSMTYDILRGTTVLFGGFGSTGLLADTWEWNGVNWNRRLTASTPPARQDHALTFDMLRARVVIFGGCSGAGPDLDDTWEFDGNTWMRMQTANHPSLRRLARMEYDAARGRTILFGGGRTNLGPSPNDTWEWDGVVWTMRSPATSPPSRWRHNMTYDHARARIVLCGGSPSQANQFLTDTWTWDGTTWTQELATAPTSPLAFGLAYHATGDLVVRFGGYPGSAAPWFYDRVIWRCDSRLPSPLPRVWCTLAHDIARGRTVMFGGLDGMAYLGDTWEYDPGTVARWTPYGSGCAGTAGVPVLQPLGASRPILNGTFRLELIGIPGSVAAISFGFSNAQWNGNTLPFDLGAIGMTGCTMYASPDVVAFPPVVVGRATQAWTLPHHASLIGVSFFNQGFVLDPGINPTGVTVSNAGVGTIGPF